MATTFQTVANNAVSTLATTMNTSVTTAVVQSGEGALFPASGPFHITIESEILICTSRSGDTLTVSRGAESTTAAIHTEGSQVALNIISKHISDLNTAVNAVETILATSGGLRGNLSDETGSGGAVFATSPTLASPVLNTGVSGSAVLDEDDMSSNSATKIATQQSIKAYVDTRIATEDTIAELNDTNIGSLAAGHILVYDNTASVWDNVALSGGTGLTATLGDGTLALAIDSTVTTLGGSQVLTSKTLTAPTINGVVGGTQTSATITALTISSMAGNWTNAGRTVANMGTVTTIDINGGTIDGATVGATGHSTIKGTTIDATDDFTIGATVITNGVITDSSGLSLAADVTVTGDLIVNGDTVTVNTATLSVEDPLIALATGNGADSVDVGLYAKYTDSGVKYSGLFRDASDSDKWKLFATTGGSHAAPTTTVNTTSGFTLGTLVASAFEGDLTGDVTGNADTVTTNADLTGDVTSSGNATTIAGLAYSKLAALASGNILVGNGSNVAVSVNPSGDVDVTNAGVFSIASGSIIDDDVKSDAAIAISKLATITLATNTTGDYVQNITGGVGIDSNGATSGENIAHSLTLDLSELTDTAIADGDYIVFTDTTNSNASVKGDLADVATLFAGAGMTATSSVLNVIGGTGITANADEIVITPAQTTITSLLAPDIKIGEDDQTKVDFETEDEIHFYAANVEQVYVADNIFGPQSDSDVDLGTTGVRWKDAFVDSIAVTGEVAAATLDISGNVDIDGVLETDNLTVGGAQGSDGQVLTSTGSGVGWEAVAAGGGISVVDQWDINVAPQGSANPITSWVQTVNDGGAYNIGGQMSQSSGVFTFPSTGTYQVHFNWNYVTASSSPDNQFQIQIQTSLDGGSSWQIAAHTGGGLFSTTAGQTATVLWMFDVTDVSNRLVRFTIANCAAGTYGYGSGTGGPSASWATFVRLADSS